MGTNKERLSLIFGKRPYKQYNYLSLTYILTFRIHSIGGNVYPASYTASGTPTGK